MSNLIKLKINGEEIEVEKGTLLIEAAKKMGVEVPHFCYHPKLKPDANCRMCLVEIEKMPKLQTSCSTPATEGMVVWTGSPKVKDAQAGVMEFILGNHPLDCPVCDQGGECHLQDLAHQHAPTQSRFVEEKRVFDKEYFGPLIEKQMNRCIVCLRCVRYCDEVVDSNALGQVDRGSATQIGGFAHHELDCEFCGGCVQICPVGALTSRLALYDYRPWQLKKTETVCNYCADGCGMVLEAVNGKVVRVTSENGVGRNEGDLCARGFFGYGFINHEGRLTRPVVRQKGKPFQTTWEHAIDKAADGLKAIRDQYGPQAIAGAISARCSNEEIYLFQKLMRRDLGTPHVDSSARYGYLNAVAALNEVFGTTRLARYEDIVQADVLLSFAGEMTETNPIVAMKVKKAVKMKGAKLIAVDAYSSERDAYRSHLPHLAHRHLQIKFGSEGGAILGLMKALAEGPAPQGAAPAHIENVKQGLSGVSFEKIEAATGVAEKSFREAAALYAGAKRAVLIFGRSILRSRDGYRNALHLADLALLSGHAVKPGSGLLALAEKNNELGAAEMGGAAEYLPGLLPAKTKGHTLVEMIDAAARGEIKALYLVGEDPLRSLPQKKVKEALRNLELLICQDLFMSESAELAHIVFPAASYAEKEGRFTSQEGEIQKFYKAIEPVGLSKPDWALFSILSRKMGASAGAGVETATALLLKNPPYKNVDEIWKEITMGMPQGYPRPDEKGVSAKIASYVQKGIDRARYALPAAEGPANGHFNLQVGQVLFHSGKMSTYADGLTALLPKELLLIHPDDARRLGVEEGETVELSAGGAEPGVRVPVKFSKKIGKGTLFFPEHFGEGIRKLAPLEIDPTTGVPYGERGRVTLSKIAAAVPS